MINHNPKEISPKLWVELIVFMSAYYPLFLILLIRDISSESSGLVFGDTSWGLFISFWALALFFISSLTTLLSAWVMRHNLTYQQGGIPIRVSNCRQLRGDMLNYTLPFMIGLFAFDYSSWQSITSLLVFLVFMFVFVRNDRVVLLNPMFLLMGIRLYDISYLEIGRNVEMHNTVLCLGLLTPSERNIFLKESAGIKFIFPDKNKEG